MYFWGILKVRYLTSRFGRDSRSRRSIFTSPLPAKDCETPKQQLLSPSLVRCYVEGSATVRVHDVILILTAFQQSAQTRTRSGVTGNHGKHISRQTFSRLQYLPWKPLLADNRKVVSRG
eukprot:765386-Hanusia_phi.AAC.2